MSNAQTDMFNFMMEEKVGVKKKNSKKGFEKNEHVFRACYRTELAGEKSDCFVIMLLQFKL